MNKCEIIEKNTKKLKEISEIKGGKFLSEKYINAKTKLKFECRDGHIFETSPHGVMNGNWCKICTKSISESLCKYIFENLLNVEFNSIFIKYDGHNLELDGYNDELKIAFEYNGCQHYVKSFYIKEKDLGYRKHLDDLKIKYCEENNIKLIVIPYIVKHINIVNFIKDKLNFLSINFIDKDLKIKDYINNYSYTKERMIKVENYIKSKNGILIDYGTDYALIRCDKGHEWKFNMYMLNLETWCNACAYNNQRGKMFSNNNKKVTIDYVKNKCVENKVICLSDELTKLDNLLKSEIQIKCERGHISDYIIEDLFFNINHKRKICKCCLDDEQYKFIDKLGNKGIIPLRLNSYIDRYTEIEWRCGNDHIFSDKAKNITERIRKNETNKNCKICKKCG